jgi:hypothetical protein
MKRFSTMREETPNRHVGAMHCSCRIDTSAVCRSSESKESRGWEMNEAPSAACGPDWHQMMSISGHEQLFGENKYAIKNEIQKCTELVDSKFKSLEPYIAK